MHTHTKLPDHLLSEIDHEQTFETENSTYSVLSLKNRVEKIWHQKAYTKVVSGDMPEDKVILPCATTAMKMEISNKGGMSWEDKLRWRSKYFGGSCVAYVLFLNGPTLHFKTDESKRIASFMGEINWGLSRLTNLKRNDGKPIPKINFTTVCDGIAYDTDVDPPGNWDIVRNIKQFLFQKNYFSGSYADTSHTMEFLEAMQNFINDFRDYYKANWGIFLVCTAGNARCWANGTPYGFTLLTETTPKLSDVVLHEILHLFGTSDEYPKPADCDANPYGWYDIKNYNCGTNDGLLNCMMGNFYEGAFTGKDKICKASAEQLSLIEHNGINYKPERDYISHTYNLRDSNLKNNGGTWLTYDLIREGGRIDVSVTGSTKMNPVYFPHGPGGDLNTIVGNDHLLPGAPFSCVIGRWRSIDGSNLSPWFKIGNGGTFTAPYTAFLLIAVNDKRDSFGDNSGYLDVVFKTLLKDNYGPRFSNSTKDTKEPSLDPGTKSLENIG